jgi:hypothetical protein
MRGAAVGAGTAGVFLILGVTPGRDHWAWLVGAVFMVLLTLWVWRMGIRIEADGVQVIGMVGSQSVCWKDIDRFVVAPAGGYPYVGHVRLRSGEDLWTFGLSAAGWPRSERKRVQVQRPIDRLNGALAEWRANQT